MNQASAVPTVDVDDYGRHGLRVTAPLKWRLIVPPFCLTMGVFMGIVFLRDPSSFSPFMQWLGPGMAAFFIVGSVEYVQRVFLFYPDQVRIRILWLWRTVTLPARIRIGITGHYEVILTDAATDRRCLRIPRDYTRAGQLAEDLATYYERWQRLG